MYNMQQQAALYDLFYMSMKACGHRRECPLHLMPSMHKVSPRTQWGTVKHGRAIRNMYRCMALT